MMFLEYIGENMSPLVPWMALMWFVLGILVGQRMQPPTTARRSERGDEGRRGSGGGERRVRNGAVEIYVGNLAYAMKESELDDLFAEYGAVESARIIKNGYSGKSKGYGFVVMTDRAEAEAAIKALHGTDVAGRELAVNEARTRSRAR